MSTFTNTARRFATGVFRTRSIASLLLAFAAATAAACSSNDDGPSGPDGSLIGSYDLQQVDGDAPPVTIFDDDVQTEDGRVVRLRIAVTNGSLELDDNEEFAGNLDLRLTVQGESQNESLAISGEYSRSGNTISFESDDPDGPNFEGTIRNGRLELDLDIFGAGNSSTYTFRK